MAENSETQPRSTPPLLARTQSSAAGAIDDVLASVAQLFDDTARTLGEGRAEDAVGADFGRDLSLKLHDAAQSLRRRSGTDIVDTGLDIARRHPRIFVSGSAALAGLAAYLLIAPASPSLRTLRPARRSNDGAAD